MGVPYISLYVYQPGGNPKGTRHLAGILLNGTSHFVLKHQAEIQKVLGIWRELSVWEAGGLHQVGTAGGGQLRHSLQRNDNNNLKNTTF
jgi:hypothetical protein